MNSKITFYTGVGSVTGANFLFELGNKRILVDCGLVQGEREAMGDNRLPFGYDPKSIDILFVTHAHLDHVGRIPKLIKEGFVGEIYSTSETRSLAELILEDAVNLLKKSATEQGLEPLYTEQDMRQSFNNWKTIDYHTDHSFGDFSVYLKDSGHILGASMFEFRYKKNDKDRKVVFTGDLGNSPSPLLRDTESIEGADYVVMESVYGDRNHEPKSERIEKLERIIKDTINKKGTLVIPAFSLERTQVLIYEMNNLIENKIIPSIPVYIDSPLATRITEVYKRGTEQFNKQTREQINSGDDIFSFPKLSYTHGAEESKSLERIPGPKIIIAGSGMSVGGRVIRHEEIYLPDPNSTILLVGYQTLGTIGRHLLDGDKKVTIGHDTVKVKARIDSILGYSSHKDSDHLVEFVNTAQNTLKKAFVVMGEFKSSTFLSQRIKDELGIQAVCPEVAKTYELE